MTVRTVGAIGLSAAALAAISGATPAYAAPDCGAVPAGATLTVLNTTTCQLDFAAAGTYSWTVPAGAAGIQALLLGGGSGSAHDEFVGYAGSGGSVLYVDYTGTGPAALVDIVVGDGGLSFFADNADAGEDTTTTVAAVTSIADGAPVGSSNSCAPEGDGSVFASNGDSATTVLAGFTGNCETSYAAGLNPSIDATDSYSNARPAIFSDLNLELGAGGRILPTVTPLPAFATLAGTGSGSNIHYNNVLGEFDTANSQGGNGRVIVRYTTSALVGALAATGVEATTGLAIAGAAAGLGAVLLAISRRRKAA